MGGFLGGIAGRIFGGESSAQKREKRERQAQQTKIDEDNRKRKKKLDEESLVAQSRAKSKIKRQGARRSVVTSALGIVDDPLA